MNESTEVMLLVLFFMALVVCTVLWLYFVAPLLEIGSKKWTKFLERKFGDPE